MVWPNSSTIELSRVGVDHVIDLVHLALFHQELDDINGTLRHAVCQLLNGDRFWHHHLASRSLSCGSPGSTGSAAFAAPDAPPQGSQRALPLAVIERVVEMVSLHAYPALLGIAALAARLFLFRAGLGPAFGSWFFDCRASGLRRLALVRSRGGASTSALAAPLAAGRLSRRTLFLGGRRFGSWLGFFAFALLECLVLRRTSGVTAFLLFSIAHFRLGQALLRAHLFRRRKVRAARRWRASDFALSAAVCSAGTCGRLLVSLELLVLRRRRAAWRLDIDRFFFFSTMNRLRATMAEALTSRGQHSTVRFKFSVIRAGIHGSSCLRLLLVVSLILVPYIPAVQAIR